MNTTSLRKTLVCWSLALLTAFGLVTPSHAVLDKTRFVADLGIAYYCYHHWVSTPYKTGAFAPGAPHKTKAVIKAGAALLFALNRVKAANKIAQTSKDPILHKLAGGLDSMIASVGSLGQKFKGGKMDPTDLSSLDSTFGAVTSRTSANGLEIKDKAVAIPGL